MFNKKIIAAAIAVSGLFINATANAQAYVGATVGQAHWNADCAGTISCNNNDTSFNILGGYNFNQNWGVEASYYSLGTAKSSTNVMGIMVNSEMKGTGFDLAGVYRAQLNNNWGLFTKLGVTDTKAETNGYFLGRSISGSKNSTQLMVGFGATYAFTPNLALRAEIDSRKVDVAINGYASSGNVTNFNIGVQASF